MAADVFVLPTREDIWGLVINEAMAYGLPVITTDKCNAGLELIQNGINGFVIKKDSEKELMEAVTRALSECTILGALALHEIKDYTIESMVLTHVNFFQRNNVVEKNDFV